MTPLDRWLRLSIYGLSISLIVLSLVGGWLWFSPIPYLDMWDGTIAYLMRSEGFPPDGLFGQHNEHRIALTRLLFWFDYNLFGGRHIFLILFNYACAAAAWWVFWICLKEINSDGVERRDLTLVGMILGGWLFLWSQSENFIWAFQSQFFLTQLLPLGAFLCLCRTAQTDARKNLFFGWAVLMGCASAIAMANGVMALPLMVVWAMVLRLHIWRVLALAGVSALVLGLYFNDYVSPSHHSTLLGSLLAHPLDMLLFTFKYLASPFAHVISPLPPASYVILLLGLALTVFAMFRTYKLLREPPENAVSGGLLLFIIYIGATAFVTAGGRLFMSEYTAFAYRYTTPAIMAWAAAFCLASPWVFRLFYGSSLARQRLLVFATLGVMALFVPVFRTIVPDKDFHFNQSVAVLALELGINDHEQIAHVYPNAEPVLRTAQKATARDFGIFGRAPYQGLREMIGQTVEPLDVPECRSSGIDATFELDGTPDFVRVSGGVSEVARNARGSRILIVDEENTVLGAGLLNRPRSVTDATDKKVGAAAFTAYLKAESREQPLTIVSEACR